MRERLDEHSLFLEAQLAGLEALVVEKGETDVVVPALESEEEPSKQIHKPQENSGASVPKLHNSKENPGASVPKVHKPKINNTTALEPDSLPKSIESDKKNDLKEPGSVAQTASAGSKSAPAQTAISIPSNEIPLVQEVQSNRTCVTKD